MRYLNLFLITLAVASFTSAAPAAPGAPADSIVGPTDHSNKDGVSQLVGSAANNGDNLVGIDDVSGSQYENVRDPYSSAPLIGAAAILMNQINKSNNQADRNLISQLINSAALKYGTRSSVDSASSAGSLANAGTFSEDISEDRPLTNADCAAGFAFRSASSFDAVSASSCATTACAISLARATIALMEKIAKSYSEVNVDLVNKTVQNVIRRKNSLASSSTSPDAASSRPTKAFIEEILKSSKQLNNNEINQFIRDTIPTANDQVSKSSVP